ncbi:MAG: hypothetical protein ACI9BW_003297 [Gammaproteobacteria bacterium]|jgi:hypothetical protein
MKLSREIEPYVLESLAEQKDHLAAGDYSQSFLSLENAHVTGQQSTKWHTIVLLEMLRWAFHQKNLKELFGQLLRAFGAFTKTVFGLVPSGNTGGANVSPFKSMPISIKNQAMLDRTKTRNA